MNSIADFFYRNMGKYLNKYASWLFMYKVNIKELMQKHRKFLC